MTDATEASILAAMVARMERIDGSDGYTITLGSVEEQRIDLSGETDSMPLVSVVVPGGSIEDEGTSPRYVSQEMQIELVGCIAAGRENRTKPLDLLLEMKRAAFEPPDTADVITDCVSYLRATDWAVFLARKGEPFTQVSLYLTARFGDDTLEQD